MGTATRLRLLAMAVVAGLLAAMSGTGCGGSPTAGPTGPTGPTGTVVTMKNFRFEPDDPVFQSGTSVTVVNDSPSTHTFTIEETDVDLSVRAGQTAQVLLDLSPGTYDLVCTIHLLDKMRTDLTITS